MKPPTLLSLFTTPLLATAQTILNKTVPPNDILESFVSYSIEFSSFPDYAGNKSHPNTFSLNLLANLPQTPYIRVGGNTQDYALFNASLPFALNGTFNLSRSSDYPTTIFIGPSFFESYTTWPSVKFTHGFNLGLGANNSAGWQTLLDTVPLACKALGNNLHLWTYGNEPDLFSTSAQGPVRPASWNESTYVWQWHNGTSTILSLVAQHCPELSGIGFMAPSHAGVGNRLKAPAVWAAGFNRNKTVQFFSTHNYISGATSPGVTLQGTLMNHTVTRRSVDAHVVEYNSILRQDPSAPPMVFGEANSLYNQGRPGLSNTFGAALWGVDFHLYAASVGFKRVYMHQGSNYRYAAWQPLTTRLTTIGTKPPYYGSIAVAAALGSSSSPATVVHIPLSTEKREAAYGVYTNSGSVLVRIMVVNMRSYNTTLDGAGLVPLPDLPTRGSVNYTFSLTGSNYRTAKIQRLWANGSDAITGVTWDGWSYNYELDQGRPARLKNVTNVDERVEVVNGSVTVAVADSSAALLTFEVGDEEGEGGQEQESKGGKRWNILGW